MLRTSLLVALLALAPAQAARYALLVGVRQYDRAELTPLNYPENDVAVLAEVLRVGGYRRVVLLTQTRGAFEERYRPTAKNIRRELKAFLDERTDGDTVLVAFCGHGVQLAGSDEPYFCPADTKLGEPATLLSLGEVYQSLAACKARAKVLLSDSCRNDPLSGDSRGILGKVVSMPKDLTGGRKPPENVVALFSCSAGEHAYESKKLRHGVFFHYLIEGLRGKATRNRQVTLGTLTDFVQREVPDFVRGAVGPGVQQRPELVGRFSGTLALLELPQGKLTVDVRGVKDLQDRALSRIVAGDYKGAVLSLDRALAQGGDSALPLAMRAHALDMLGQRAKALADADRALRLDPNLAAAHHTRGNVALFHDRDARRAVAEFDAAIARSPNHLMAHVNRARAHARLKDVGRAMADYAEALRIDPRYFVAYVERGALHAKRGEEARARADLDAASRIDPKLAMPYYLRGNLHLKKKEHDRAIRQYTEALAREPAFPQASYQRGMCHFHKGEAKKAIDDFDEVIRRDPRHAQAYNARGVSKAKLGRWKEALADYTKAVELDGGDAMYLRNRARAHEQLGQKAKADDDRAKAAKLTSQASRGR
jgi:tetratricopeptide (TPR) repeat protein